MILHIAPIQGTARQTVRRLIDTHVGSHIALDHDVHGAPLLVGSPLHISISHSRHFAAIALHPHLRIGIDIEEPRGEQLAKVKTRFVHPDDPPIDLLTAWTIKEAVYKAAGIPGLSLLDIRIVAPTFAYVPHCAHFTLTTRVTVSHTHTLAIPYPLTVQI